VIDTKSFQLVSNLTGQLDSQRIFVPCEARILWYSADRTSSRALRDTTHNLGCAISENIAHVPYLFDYYRKAKCVDAIKAKYGKHTVFLGTSFLAHRSAQHDGERGHLPERRRELLPGETARKRLGIPMFMGEVT
jgi:hypothetical protein